MASTYTSKLNLEKPDGNDDISVLAINGNSDKIESFASDILHTNQGTPTTLSSLSTVLDNILVSLRADGIRSFQVNFSSNISPFKAATYLCTLYKSGTNTTYSVAIFRRVDSNAIYIASRNANGWSYVEMQPKRWEEVTSAFSINTTYCRDFHAYSDGHQIFFTGYALAGTPDQTNLITNISSAYRPITFFAANAFWMNWSDSGKSIVLYVMTSAIQIRTVENIEGSGGVLFSGSYPIQPV